MRNPVLLRKHCLSPIFLILWSEGPSSTAVKEIRDIIAYLNLIANLSDNISLSALLTNQNVELAQEPLRKSVILRICKEMSMLDASSQYYVVWHQRKSSTVNLGLCQYDLGFARKLDQLTITELVEAVLEKQVMSIFLMLRQPWKARRGLKISKRFLSVTKNFDDNPDSQEEETGLDKLSHFLNDLALIADTDTGSQETSEVTLMTLHAAKGLEFPVVFIIGMEENVFPLSRAAEDPDELEEERRLAYVGITRGENPLSDQC